MCQKRYMGDSPLIKGLNYNNPGDDVFADSGRQGHASIHVPKPCRPMNYNQPREQAATMPTPWRRSQGHETAIRRNSAAQRITMLTAPTSKTSCPHPRPAPICAPRGGQRYKPRPEPRRHHLTHAADTGHTSPKRRHQPKPPCHVSIYDTKQGGFIFYCGKN